ncbi:conserved hypothetical protein [Candidatus Brocadia pituitae]|nr:conserved hypothetical protein [Candidatus Brocadia pituitae]
MPPNSNPGVLPANYNANIKPVIQADLLPEPLSLLNTGVCAVGTISKGLNNGVQVANLNPQGGNGAYNATPTTPTKTVALKEEFIGAKISGIKGEDESVTKVSYFKGNDPSKWKNNISTYELVNLGEIYDGIELKLKAHGNNVEKLLYVKPGAVPEQIKISLSDMRDCGVQNAECETANPKSEFQNLKLQVNEHGELVAETELGPVKFTKPIAYQMIDGKRVEVAVDYILQNTKSETRNSKRQNPKLVVSEVEPSKIQDVEAEVSNPKSKIANRKFEYGFTVASYDRTKDLVIDPLLASTYLGGSGEDYAWSIALDTSGNVYVTGVTYSSDFPATSGAYDTSFSGGGKVFVSKLGGGLTSLLASTFLGGNSDDRGYSLILDTNGNVYVTGLAGPNFPTTSGAYDTSFDGGYDVFVSKLDGGLTNLLASTFLGGSSEDWGYSLCLDTSGNVYVTGFTTSTDFPTTDGAYDTSFNGGYDVFISKLNSGLTNLLASTYLGGYDADIGYALRLDTSGNVYVTGVTYSSDFPATSGAYDTSWNGADADVFVSKLNSGLTRLLASTFLGGSSFDEGYSLALDTNENIYVTGYTYSTHFPMTNGAYDTNYNGGEIDVFVSKLDGNLSASAATTPTPTPSPSPSPTPTITPEVDPLLEKYAPILYMHSKERFHPTNVKVMLDNSELYEKKCKKEKKTGACKKYEGAQVLDNKDKKLSLAQLMNEYNDNVYYLQLKKEAKKKVKKDWKERQTVYARQTKDTNEDGKEKTILQYWFFYVYNDWGTSDKLGNTHEGDWEMIQIELGENKQPERISFSYHHGGVTFGWDDKDEDNKDKVSKDGNHPHVYVTLGGHGCWNSPDDHTWYQRKALDCWKCTDKTDRYGDVLHPNSMSDSEISEIQSSA